MKPVDTFEYQIGQDAARLMIRRDMIRAATMLEPSEVVLPFDLMIRWADADTLQGTTTLLGYPVRPGSRMALVYDV